MEREQLGSRLGFLFISAGCAIGLGNVWRFPYIVGMYGGGAFVIIYLFFLVILGLPIMVMEFSVGRASRKSVAKSFEVLEPTGSKWHLYSYFAMLGNYLLMMFYTTIAGWMIAYVIMMMKGDFIGLNTKQVGDVLTQLNANPGEMLILMILTVLIGFGICSLGLQRGVEKITKIMMSCLFLIMAVLVVRAVTLDGAVEGLKFYLLPDFSRMMDVGISETIFAAMGQAFFTLSIGIGSLAIFGSYIGKERRLLGESVNVALLDTAVALIAGLIVFPSCFAFGIEPGQGPGLLFVTLPNIFNSMAGGRIWGTLFFIFMSFAALSTVVAVFENILSFAMDLWKWSRKKAVIVNIFLVIVLSIPCVLGFNLWSEFQPLGVGTNILDLEDFIVSNNLLPLGSIVYLLFCVTRYGWGFDGFLKEANTGKGLALPRSIRFYLVWILPIIIFIIFIQGYISKFFI